MKKNLFSIFFCVILFSIPLRIRSAECSFICLAVNVLPSAGQLGFLALSGTTMYLSAYLGFRQAFVEQNQKGINRVQRKVAELEKSSELQKKFNKFVASKLEPSNRFGSAEEEFNNTLTASEQVIFALQEVVIQ